MGVEEVKDFKIRPMKCELNFLSKSDGSAILSQGMQRIIFRTKSDFSN